MLGPFVNSAAVILGGVVGNVIRRHLPEGLKQNLPLTCGLIALSIGTVMVNKVHTLPPVALALLMGTAVGEVFHLETRLEAIIRWIQQYAEQKYGTGTSQKLPQGFFVKFVTI